MKVKWEGSTDPNEESGIATLEFDSGNVTLSLASFQQFHRLTGLIQREIDNAVWHGRQALKREIEAIKA